MPKSDLREFELQLRTETYAYRTPMKFGGRVVTDVTILTADCPASSGLGSAMGLGSMTMGVAWAWPVAKRTDGSLMSDDDKLQVVLELANRLCAAMNNNDQSGHPLDVCHRFVAERDSIAVQLAEEMKIEPIPGLAVLLAGSPLEAALFDAHGKAANESSYALLSREHLPNDLSHYLDESYKGVYLADLISAKPVDLMPLYHLVGALDPLTNGDLDQPVGDGMPETLGDWIQRDGLTHLKIKLAGEDLDWDVNRVAGIHAVATENRTGNWDFSLDFNERCENEDYVLEMLNRLREVAPGALPCIQYIEQPTHRDLEKHPELTMHRVAKEKPVVIDESLVGLASLRTAIKQGYSGIALKACKGHAEALLLGAVARHENYFLCVQDLTCVGASLLHSASLAAHIPGVAAIESNGRQFSPAGNERWMEGFGEFFRIQNGKVPTSQLAGPGLGYGSDPATKD